MVGNSNGFFQWNSSAPYLFGGLGIVFGIIGMALLVLSCYRHNPTSPENSLCDDAKEKSVEKRSSQGGDELKIVVVMAGDDQPTYVAKPVSLSLPVYIEN
ncbi:Protein GLUTAMINE DUMPER like [Quillaja saponaria]|uniref:Protein GLUTAMINE DUMPER like n=1 Tax=Quillaja saponaria TaxID=32244 RepID=A0AAD7PI74_QUISA|nr:Protein GLUTAMINE DUMPER like [Quillaja saponaria]